MQKTTLISLWILLVLLASGGIVQAIEPGDALIPFKAKDMDGKTVDLATIVGNKPVMLVFWASWCPNCSREVPKINALIKRYGTDALAIVGINVGYNDSQDRARLFMKSYGMEYPVIFDREHTLSSQYRVRGVPTIVLANRQGKVVQVDFAVPDISAEQFRELSR